MVRERVTVCLVCFLHTAHSMARRLALGEGKRERGVCSRTSVGLSHSFTHNSPIHTSFETVVW